MRTTRAQLEADAVRHKDSALELVRLRKEVDKARNAVEADRSHKQAREEELQNLKKKTETRLRKKEKTLHCYLYSKILQTKSLSYRSESYWFSSCLFST